MTIIKSFQEFEGICEAVEELINIVFHEAILMEGYIFKDVIEVIIENG